MSDADPQQRDSNPPFSSHAQRPAALFTLSQARQRYLLRVILPYLIFASVWILFSDLALEYLVPDPARRITISIYKGFGFILTTAILLYLLLRVESRARFRAERHMRLAQLKYETVFKNSPDFICIVTREGVLMDANAAFRDLVDRPNGVKGLRYLDLAVPVDAADVLRYEKALELGGGRTSNFRTQIRLPNGEVRDFLLSGFVIKLRETELVFTNGHDVTELRRAEDLLRTSETEIRKQKVWLEKAERVGRVGGWSIELGSRQTWASEQARALCGLEGPDDFSMDRFLSLVQPGEEERIRKAFNALVEHGDAYDLEFSIQRADNGKRVDLHSIAEYDHDSGVVLGIIQDISERKEHERRRQELATLLDIANDAVYVRSLDHAILYWNKGSELLYGWAAEEAMGQLTTELFSRDLAATREIQKLLLEQGSWSGERTHVKRNGEQAIVFARLTLVTDSTGAPQAVMAINTDITEKKRLEAQLLRTQRLESLGALSSGIAHDLNNVLAPILMSISLLKEEVQSQMGRQILATIEASARRGSDVVRQVLTFAKGASGEPILLQPEHLVREIYKIVRETFPKSIRLRLDEASEIWPILADGTQVHQALMNLCVNARDAMPDGGILTLGIANVDVGPDLVPTAGSAKPGPHVRLSVEDTGSGIPPAVLDKIFEHFFTTKPTGQGTGLGLSTVLGIVQGHGGFVCISSSPGQGSRFELYFAARQGEVVVKPAVAAPAPPKGKGEMILLVDDEQAVREVLRHSLEANGYVCLPAGEGAEAVSLFIQHRDRIAAVLTDMMMPNMDGAALTRILRRTNPKLPIIGMSGVGDLGSIKDLDALRLNAFIGKPCPVSELLQCLAGVFEQEAIRLRDKP